MTSRIALHPAPPRGRHARQAGRHAGGTLLDLVFVLALTQCTALMAAEPNWRGRWRRDCLSSACSGGPRWRVTPGSASIVDPEEGVVRVATFGCDDRCPRRRALCARSVRQGGAAARGRVWRGAGSAEVALFLIASRDGHSPLGDRPAVRHGRRGQPPSAVPRSPTVSSRERCGQPRWRSTWQGPYVFGSQGWRLDTGPLRRAPRPDHHHRAGRVAPVGRRRGRRARTRGGPVRRVSPGRRRWRRRCGGCTSTSSRSSPSGRFTRVPGRAENSNEIARDSLLLPALPDGRRNRAARSRTEEDRRTRRGAPRDGAGRRDCSGASRSICSPTSP